MFFFNVLGCASQTQVFDFEVDQKKDVETSSGIDLSIRWVEVDGDSVTVSLDSQPDGYERTLWIESDSSKEEYRPESDIFEINLEDGEYVFWAEYTSESNDVYGQHSKIQQYVGSNRLIFRSEITLPFAMDVWAQDDLAVIAGGLNNDISMLLVDMSDVFDPTILYTFENIGYVRDVKIFDNLLFAAVDADSDGCTLCDGVGVRIYDISEPLEPVLLSEISDPTTSVHNLYYDKGFLYVASQSERTLAIFDIRTLTEPNRIASWEPNMMAPPMALDPGIGAHDMVVIDDMLYVAHGLGFSVVDVSNPYLPKDMNDQYVDFGTHNIWPSHDGEYVFTTREISSGPLQVWKEGDDGFDLLYTDAHDVITVHNVHIQGDYAFVSWYTDGVYVFDVSDISMPLEVGHFDTYEQDVPMLGSGSDGQAPPPIMGAWGICPYGSHVVVGDTMRGLLLFDFFPKTISIDDQR